MTNEGEPRRGVSILNLPYVNRESRPKDPFALWGKSVKDTLRRKGFSPKGLVDPLIAFARAVAEIPDLTALSLAVAHNSLVGPCAQLVGFLPSAAVFGPDHSSLWKFRDKKQELLSRETVAPWQLFLGPAPYLTLAAEDIGESLLTPRNIQEGYVFIGGIWFDRTPSPVIQPPLSSDTLVLGS